ncbi:hypothetical protein [Corynebacterium sputi]|uniref:hypothetical protein n=1 Tax=Corynebacterium sputi TaxID=489915 RepID=UPI0004787B64|nr:hypothetical protein [Corynebacterium sputi]
MTQPTPNPDTQATAVADDSRRVHVIRAASEDGTVYYYCGGSSTERSGPGPIGAKRCDSCDLAKWERHFKESMSTGTAKMLTLLDALDRLEGQR